MITIQESPQRCEFYTISHSIENDILTVTINGISEVFDFTGLPEGTMQSIEVESLPVNPIVKAEKIGENVVVKLLRFYTEADKHLFEVV